MGGLRLWLGVSALALIGGVFACDDSDDRIRGGASDAGSSNATGAGDAGGVGSGQGGEGQQALGGSESASSGSRELPAAGASIEGDAGAAGAPPCDAACLDSVVSQPSDFGMAWRSSWFLMGCKEQRTLDCVTAFPAPCSDDPSVPFEDRGAITLETFPIGGVPGKRYKVTFTFNAIAAAKEYQGGTRDQGTAVHPNWDTALWDTFYRDGEPIPSKYDPWKLSVLDADGVELRHYYMNAFPPGTGYESHRTYQLSYTKSIVVVGGGQVTHRVQDPNCQAIDNCSIYDPVGPPCIPRHLPNEPQDQSLPAQYQDPQDGMLKPLSEISPVHAAAPQQPWHSQLGHLTITAVEETDDPVTHDYM
jgi:hypothetical protein